MNSSLLSLFFASLFLFSLCARVADAQIVVLGMHHSGTSAVTKMVSMMGAQVGSDSELIVSSSKEFYERKDVVELNDLLFQHAGVYEQNKRPTWVGYGFSPAILESKTSLLENFRVRAEKIILDHLAKSGRTWAIKDPRLSLTIKYWLEVYDKLVEEGKIPNVEATCVIVHRDLFPMMKTLWRWSNDKPNGLNAEEWLAVWNAYVLSIGDACSNRRIVLVRNVDAWDSVEYFDNFQHLFAALSMTYSDLQLPSKDAIYEMASALKTPRTRHTDSEKYRADVMKPVLGHLTTELLYKIEAGRFPVPDKSFSIDLVWTSDFSSSESVLPVFESVSTTVFGSIQEYINTVQQVISSQISNLIASTPVIEPVPLKKEAYVTLITGDNPLYMGLALTLAKSIRKHDTNRDIIALLVEETVSKDWEPILKSIGYKVQYVSTIPEPWLGKKSISRCHAPQDIINRWGKLMTKLQTFTLVEYEKLIFLDSDIIMVSPADAVFEINGFGGGSGNFGSEGLFNAGYMLIEPSMTTFNHLLKETNRAPPHLFKNILDCTEMGLLNKYFHKELTLLPMASPYNIVKSPFVHWFGDHKPWENLDTTCYPSPYFSNKLWAQTWEETVESMKEFTGNELFQNVFKAVMDRRAQPSLIHSDKTPIFDKDAPKNAPYAPYSAQTVQSAYQSGFDAYAYGPAHGAYSSLNSPYFEEKGFQYLDEKSSPYLEERFQYLEEKSSPYLEERFQYLEETSSPYLEERSQYGKSSPYLEERFQYLDEKSSPYLEEKFQYNAEKPFAYQEESKFQYEDEKELQIEQRQTVVINQATRSNVNYFVVGN